MTYLIERNQPINTVNAGPSSGNSGEPTFRSLVAADLPISGITAGTYSTLTVDVYGRATAGSNTSNSTIYSAAMFDFPYTTDWPMTAVAPTIAEATNPSLLVKAFDDTAEEGIGFSFNVPSGSTTLNMLMIGRPSTAPTASKGVVLRLYSRKIPLNAAIGSWSAATALTTITIPTNAYYQSTTFSLSLSTLGITSGNLYQFELTRYGASSSDTLVGDWYLLQNQISFS